MLTCAILDDYQRVSARFGDFGRLADRLEITVFDSHIADRGELLAKLVPFDIIVAMRERTPFDAVLLRALPNLKLIVTTGMRNASIDLEAARAQGILVCGTDGFAGSTTELTFALLLGLMRQIPTEAANMRNGGWQTTVGRDLRGLTMGVLGLGTLGSRTATIAQAFGMKVLGWSRNNTPERSAALGVTFAGNLDTLLAECDVVSIHLTLNADTRGLLDDRRLRLMKNSSVLINTSRGPIIDSTALISALKDGHIAGAALDVYDVEPLPADHPFRSMPNVLATPHLGYVTENSYRVFYTGVVDALEAWLTGKPIRTLNQPSVA